MLALWQALIAGVVVTPLAAFAHWGTPHLSWLWLPVLGCVYTAGFFGAYLTALKKVDASRAVVFLYLEPASAIVLVGSSSTSDRACGRASEVSPSSSAASSC